MKTLHRCGLIGMLGLGLAMPGVVRAMPADAPMVLIVPARFRVLQLAFDLKSLRPLLLFSYRDDAETAVFYRWDGRTWLNCAEPTAGSQAADLFAKSAVILVGQADRFSPAVRECLAANSTLTNVPALDVAAIINAMNTRLAFSEREWHWLAGRYGVALKDQDESRRVGNPFAIRRSELPLSAEAAPAAPRDAEPAELIVP